MPVTHLTIHLSPHAPDAPRVAREGAPTQIPPDARVEPHLTQWVVIERDDIDRVEAHYLFDDDYARAHPESVEDAHLTMFQALLTAKLFDDGALVVTHTQLTGSLLWPSIDTPRASLARRRAPA